MIPTCEWSSTSITTQINESRNRGDDRPGGSRSARQFAMASCKFPASEFRVCASLAIVTA
jgi:hypothetical protein